MSEASEVEAHRAVIEVLGELTPDEEQERHRLELKQDLRRSSHSLN